MAKWKRLINQLKHNKLGSDNQQIKLRINAKWNKITHLLLNKHDKIKTMMIINKWR